MNTEELYIWRYGIDKLPKGLLSMVNLMSVILTMKAKGRSSKTTGNGCGKTRMVGKKTCLPSYTSYAIRNRES